jgi:hypothetical protein
MNIFPKWPNRSDFIAAASRPDGVSLFQYRAMHQSVRQKDRWYQFCLHRGRVNTLLFCVSGLLPLLIVRLIPSWIGISVMLVSTFINLVIVTPVYIRGCIRGARIMKWRVLREFPIQ